MFLKIKVTIIILVIIVNGLASFNDPECTEDCTGLKFFQGGKEYIVNCRTQTKTKSFCNKITKECDTALDKCITPNNFCSLGDGFYPDLEFCTKYYFCANGEKIDYDCPKGSIYNPNKTICEFGIKCLSFHPLKLCKNKIGTMINYPIHDNYFVFCGTEPILFKCPNEEFKFNINKGVCDFLCKHAGRFYDPREGMVEWYFECVDNNGTLITYHKHCPKNMYFDPELHKCKFKN